MERPDAMKYNQMDIGSFCAYARDMDKYADYLEQQNHILKWTIANLELRAERLIKKAKSPQES